MALTSAIFTRQDESAEVAHAVAVALQAGVAQGVVGYVEQLRRLRIARVNEDAAGLVIDQVLHGNFAGSEDGVIFRCADVVFNRHITPG